MPAPKSKISRSRRGMRCSHRRIPVQAFGKCSNCGATVRSHHLCLSCGYYKNRQILG